jgi:peptide deformylase
MYSFVDRNDPILTKKIKPNNKLTNKQKKVIKEIKKFLEETKDAAAISANQVGIDDIRFFVCRNNNEILTIINPRITWSSIDNPEEIIQSDGKVVPKSVPMWEGCVSFPGRNYLVIRPYVIKVEYMNEKMVYKNATLTDQWARLFSHEIDHLNGITVEDVAEEISDSSNNVLPTSINT